MVSGWRRVFCTSIPRTDSDQTAIEDVEDAHQFTNNRLGFFSSSSSKPSTPRLRCRTTATQSPEINKYLNTPPPCSPSSFSLLKSSLRFRTRRCGICLQSMKKGSGTASFTAECSHAFHFPCVSDYVTTQGSLACPVCSSLWKEMPLLTVEDRNHKVYNEEQNSRVKLSTRIIDDVVDLKEHQNHQHKRPDFKVYNDDEPLAVLTPKSRFNPIPESDEDFQSESFDNFHRRDVEVQMSPEAVAIAASGRHLTYGIILNVKAPAPDKLLRPAPIDLVVVADVSGKLRNENIQIMKKAMRTIISSLSSSDRLSIVAFSSHSKRLTPLRRMTATGRRAVRCVVEAMTVLAGCSNANDAVKKAVKVLQDRREKNPVAAVILFSVDGCSHSKFNNIPVHFFNLAVAEEHVIGKLIGKVLNVAVQDLRLELGLFSGGSPVVITAVYCRTPQPIVLGSSSVEIGELSANEERELLVEIKLPLYMARAHQVLSVRCSYRELFTQEIIDGQQQSLVVPRPTTVRSSSASPTIQRLRNIFIPTRALAKSRRLTEGNDIAGALNVLVSARALMKQSLDGGDEFVVGLEAELSELQRRRKVQAQAHEVGRRGRVGVMRPVVYTYTDEKGEALTPTSAWRVADKLAKAAMMRKSVNRVSDLHGFEDARF